MTIASGIATGIASGLNQDVVGSSLAGLLLLVNDAGINLIDDYGRVLYGVASILAVAPSGFDLLLGADGEYLLGADGEYLYGVAE